MSTKTNFKRIALVAVAALGLGVISSVPSNAAVSGTITVTAVNGTATTSLVDSTTAGTLSVRWLATSTDSVVVSTSLNSKPSTASAATKLNYFLVDTLTSIAPASVFTNNGASQAVNSDTATITSNNASGTNYVAAKLKFQLDTTAANVVAGTYTYTVSISPYTGGGAGAIESSKVVLQDVSIVVTAGTSQSASAAAANSGALFASGTNSLPTTFSTTAQDSTTAFAAAASGTAAAVVRLYLTNSGGGTSTVRDSVTVTIDKGSVGPSGSAYGKNVIFDYGSSAAGNGFLDVYVYPDGNSGKGTITLSTLNAGSFTKTITWLASTKPATIAASLRKSVIDTVNGSSNAKAIRAQVFDANGTNFAQLTSLYAYSSDTSVISNNGTACATPVLESDYQYYTYCALTGVKAGTATITIRDAATAATSTIASNGVSMRVSTGVATSVTLATDKASYAPGEKGYLIITVKDAAGLVMPSGTYANLFDARGIQYSSGVTLGYVGTTSAISSITKIDTITGTVTTTGGATTATASWTTDRYSATTIAPSSSDPIAYVQFYAPTSGGAFTFTATGDSSLPLANRVAVTATATVTDNASAALAAVSALAVTVASLKTLITTLTNLVLKIQKKVKA